MSVPKENIPTETFSADYPPAVRDGFGEEAQVLVDLCAVLDLQNVFLFVFEQGQGISEDYLQPELGSKNILY